MKSAEIIPKTDAELMALLADSRKQLAQLAIDGRTKQVANVKQIHAVKQTVARVLTLQRQRQLALAAPEEATAQPAETAATTTAGGAITQSKEENHG